MAKTSPLNNDSKQAWSQAKLNFLSNVLCDNFDGIVRYFNLDFRQTNKMYIGVCPIHQGDNLDACNIYHTGHSHKGNWCCNTRGCESVFQASIVGFIRGLLSRIECQWLGHGDELYPFYKTIDWCLNFLGVDAKNFTINQETIDTDKFISQSSVYLGSKPDDKFSITKQQVRSRLKIPAQYYIDQQFSHTLLDKYDVGLCIANNKPMTNRVVFPVYDTKGKFLVGSVGRSIWDKCSKCKQWHNPKHNCPVLPSQPQYAKWRNSPNFDSNYWLYNYWYAAKHIRTSGIVIIVEGPKDVLRLEDAGIHNSVATFGAKLSTGQKELLDCSGAFSIIVLTDPDKAGIVAIESIKNLCDKQYNILTPQLRDKDVGAMSTDDLQILLLPLLDQFKIEI